jgi:hypothetical protein
VFGKLRDTEVDLEVFEEADMLLAEESPPLEESMTCRYS